MVKIKFVQSNGDEKQIEATVGISLMENAKANSVPGVIAECGGSMVCGTCHVWIDLDEQAARIPEPDDTEEAVLDCVRYAQPDARLSCQIQVTEKMDGLTVRVPPSQH